MSYPASIQNKSLLSETVHAAVETGWNEGLGTVIWHGATRPLEGESQTIASYARDRYVNAPTARVSIQHFI